VETDRREKLKRLTRQLFQALRSNGDVVAKRHALLRGEWHRSKDERDDKGGTPRHGLLLGSVLVDAGCADARRADEQARAVFDERHLRPGGTIGSIARLEAANANLGARR